MKWWAPRYRMVLFFDHARVEKTARRLQAWGFVCNDGKHPTRFLVDCGMVPVTRDEFCTITEKYGLEAGSLGPWAVDPALLDDKWQPAEVAGVRMTDVLPNGSRCPYSGEQLLHENRSPTW